MNKLVELIKTAHSLLNEDESSAFSDNKKTIIQLFSMSKKLYAKEKIRLAVIDSFYSTNISKTNNALTELAEYISSLQRNDKKLANIFIKSYSERDIDKIGNLFNKKFGWRSNVEDNGTKAISLISKYVYFLTNYKFPIYDSFVKSIIPKTEKYLEIKTRSKIDLPENYFIRLKTIVDTLGVSVDQFDAFGWLFGKLQENKNDYIPIIGKVTEQHKQFLSETKRLFNIK